MRAAYVALFAMLFSALSPAFAAAALADRPAALGQMLGIPEQAHPIPAADHEDCPHEATAHDVAGDDVEHQAPHDGNARHDHGIYCSFCLNGGSTAALLGAPALSAFALCASIAPVLEPPCASFPRPFRHFRSRAPPLLALT